MKHSLTLKMYTLFAASIVMTLATAFSMHSLYRQHVSAIETQSQLIDIQSEVTALQGQLWLYLQYKDDRSFESLIEQKKFLSQSLERSQIPSKKINKIQRVKKQFAELIEQDKQFQNAQAQQNMKQVHIDQRRALLTTRYNVLIQNMYEYLATQHERELQQTNAKIENTMRQMTVVLTLFSICMSFIAFMLLKKFQRGSNAISRAIENIRQRRFDHRIQCENLDAEFSLLGKTFNSMSEELEHSVYTKSQLESEINKHTQELEKQKKTLEYLSERDPLTSLLNRRSLESSLKTAVGKAQRSGLSVAVLFIDLDKFKIINDTHGHEVGDEVLHTVASRLSRCTRKTDIVGRYGGDEFVVCLDLLIDSGSVSKKAEQMIREVERPIVVNQSAYQVGVSIGIATFPLSGTSHEELLICADQAMYKAKSKGGGTFVFANEQDKEALTLVYSRDTEQH
ncbi:GGDEF family protein [Vibrio sinaloensis DSM 21326]|uniref:GGDEF family protein n=1 Tax=Vibrio sinaloensis DSM 21326 TaxID=945550 RepID=E8MDF0_PHOS4|nr:GGDEF domain-containing protein [Vibrio sinaloensis]EGA67936.1 GGDEF family protein [Vibrio sinaloensis DSM 21326]